MYIDTKIVYKILKNKEKFFILTIFFSASEVSFYKLHICANLISSNGRYLLFLFISALVVALCITMHPIILKVAFRLIFARETKDDPLNNIAIDIDILALATVDYVFYSS
jgi:uncharacterized membrane protein